MVQVLGPRIPLGTPALGRLLLPPQQAAPRHALPAGHRPPAPLSAALVGGPGGGGSEASASVPASEAGELLSYAAFVVYQGDRKALLFPLVYHGARLGDRRIQPAKPDASSSVIGVHSALSSLTAPAIPLRMSLPRLPSRRPGQGVGRLWAAGSSAAGGADGEVADTMGAAVEAGVAAGFQLATAAGPLCDEPMWGVAFEVHAACRICRLRPRPAQPA